MSFHTSQNKEIAKLLSDVISKHPHLRFSQILQTFGFVGPSTADEFYTKPSAVLERVQERIAKHVEEDNNEV